VNHFARLLLVIVAFGVAPGIHLPRPIQPDPRIALHAPLARALARQYLRRMGGLLDLDDLFAIAMAAMWEAIPSFKEGTGVTFGQYARSCMRSELRRQQLFIWRGHRRAWLEQNSIHPHDDDDRGIELPSRDPSPLVLVSRKQTVGRLRAAIALLPKRQQVAIESCYFEELTLVEAGETIGVTKQAMEQRRSKAIGLLGKHLGFMREDEREGGHDHG
jgi:RNA polymerase sigma factor (sigma-70 family)